MGIEILEEYRTKPDQAGENFHILTVFKAALSNIPYAGARFACISGLAFHEMLISKLLGASVTETSGACGINPVVIKSAP